ncbi:tetratricopeptide (TPR) repeat protein [Dysgonomonas sp. PFB1-18]|uniref:tetratricopeptide repeat protein n=1 Tax=unclassified Dysgonomonas TaxID=2630389 RepID=UPI002476290F|nr:MULTISPECIES: tetratricopeptide repeat protein [unclassified Dysgonomonas]MDH6309346.1 tetratricopeptide (TPR) repeat protein [Dysgonomonas sp. PF1-14]MDH6339789.1 tetratricopeptide (TPR) repeat protein [Dysgonomonas sp. PF1-16]MDH6381437.1 tetratricopeptide (TPR) repeat protein [Dysgonomonas sp. PFB1-18]MDH6398652.1 tetratricopeptide (TPR) repeat protein [Dysgonomonas sp. PF1-23]
MKNIIYILLIFPFCLSAQPNCNAYLFDGDTLQYKACIEAEKANGYYQFQREFQEIFDNAIDICPHFAYAYRSKSVAYLKSGDFVTWKKLIDKAVEHDAEENLGYRGWCRFQFFRDYKGAIQDIEKLESLVKYDIGSSVNGHYHLHIARGICYSAINQKQKAIEVFNNQLNAKGYSAGLYDYYQLGVTYYEVGDYENALKAFEKQSEVNELADNAYYKCKIYKISDNKDEYRRYKEQALKLLAENKRMFDPYTHHYNNVYSEMIINE